MKKLLLIASTVLLLVCAFALTVNAEECEHTGNWELKFSEDGVLDSWEAINTCSTCGLVLKDEFYAPLVVSRGYSYYADSFSQGFSINHTAISKYEEYSNDTFDFGLVAGVADQIGINPVNSDGVASQDKGIVFNFTNTSTSLLDIKVVNVPEENQGTKIVSCLYAIRGGNVIYVDGDRTNANAIGVTYNEVVDAVDNGGIPSNGEKYRKLIAEEMEFVYASYWMSNANKTFAQRQFANNTPQKFVSTRMFSRDELPSGSYVVVANGWNIRPEVWGTDVNGNIVKTDDRPGSVGAGTYKIETLWQDTDSAKSSYKYMAFNISEGSGGYLLDMSLETLTEVVQIYVPATTKVAKNEYEPTENVSVEGMKVYEWTTETLLKGKYRNNTSNTPSNTGSNSSYYTTCLFTKETLPVGSVIEISGGWLYRAEYWINSTKVGTRGNMTSEYRIVVTEEFWEGISERAFNISIVGNGSLSSYPFDEVADAFKIYVPVNE